MGDHVNVERLSKDYPYLNKRLNEGIMAYKMEVDNGEMSNRISDK